jgi:rhodanese-related sulfurtransferase
MHESPMPEPEPPTVPRISPEEAASLLEEGFVYVDVRSEPEFEKGHPPGALNVPFMHKGPGGLQPNPEFASVMQAAFARDARLIIGCQSGGRSQKAVRVLTDAGYTALRELRTGWEGARDAFGRPDPGWIKKGLPTEDGLPPGQSYADVKRRGARP